MARPVLGSQPPPPGTMPVRLADTEYPETNMELMPMQPYADESAYEWYDPHLDGANLSGYQHEDSQFEASSVMLVGQYPQQRMNAPGYPPRRSPQAPPNIKCYRCAGDHLVKDCPEPPPP